MESVLQREQDFSNDTVTKQNAKQKWRQSEMSVFILIFTNTLLVKIIR